MTRSQFFIRDHYKELEGAAEFFNVDSVLPDAGAYESAKVRVLIVFPSTAQDKGQSMTATVLNDYAQSFGGRYFMDFAYAPTRSDVKVYDKHGMPYVLGTVSHLDASHFDFVGFSLSVLHEIAAVPWLLSSFDRCDTPIPLSATERARDVSGRYPVIYGGGISAAYSDVLFGELGNGETAYLDFLHLGAIDHASNLYEEFVLHRGDRGMDFPLMLLRGLWRRGFKEFYMPMAYHVYFSTSREAVGSSVVVDGAPEMVSPYYPSTMPTGLGPVNALLHGDGGNTNMAWVDAANGCSSSGSCNFCAEAWMTGGWVERSMGDILNRAVEAKRNTASDNIKLYSFNSNYLQRFKELIVGLRGIFPSVTFNNLRLDELGRDRDLMELMRLAGQRRAAAPIEGISPRIRNNFLNKGLSEESMESFFTFMMYAGGFDVKVGLILTGWEEDEDWQWLYDFTVRWLRKSKEVGGNLPIRYKATPLVVYPLTPLERTERKAARISYNDGYWIPPKWNDAFYKDNGVRIGVNGFRFSTFIEQALLDLGRQVTWWLQRYVVEAGIPIYSFRPLAKGDALQALRGFIDRDVFFASKGDSYLSPCHRIRLRLDGALSSQRAEVTSRGLDARPTDRCLHTYSGQHPRCNPACGACSTNVERQAILHRDVLSAVKSDALFLQERPREARIFRFKVQRVREFEALNPRYTAFSFASWLLKEDLRIFQSFLRVQKVHSMSGQSEPDCLYFADGTMLIDIAFKSGEGLDASLARVFKSPAYLPKSYWWVGYTEVSLSDRIEYGDWNVFRFESTLPGEVWDYVSMRYAGEVYEKESLLWKLHRDSDLFAPTYRLGAKVTGHFAVPVRYSPWYYLRGLLSHKRLRVESIMSNISVSCVGTVRVSGGTRSHGTIMDLYNLKTYPMPLQSFLLWLTHKS